jgi:DNA adenine methylase
VADDAGGEGAGEGENIVTAKPFVKAVGGKTFLAPEILRRLPTKMNTYYEPFVGGGAIFFALAAEGRFKQAVLGDANVDLACTYNYIARYSSALVLSLKAHASAHNEKHYYAVRSQRPELMTAKERAARFIYLNKTCFNGLHRVNRKGEFNVPIGSYKNPTICDEENLYAVASVLRRVLIVPGDFKHLVLGVGICNAKKGDAVYFDPPYVPLTPTANFTTYTAGGFGLADQTRLRDVAAALVKRGVHVLLSNADTPLVRKLYRGFKIEKVEAPRRVNSKASKRGNVGELLISGKPK